MATSDTPYKLIIGSVVDRLADPEGQYLNQRVNLKQIRFRWNRSMLACQYGYMQFERVDGQYIVYIMLPSETDAVIFTLMHASQWSE